MQANDRCDCESTQAIRLLNLLNPLPTLLDLTAGRIRAGAWLDAFLFSAGSTQVLEDALHPDPWNLRRATEALRRRTRGQAGRCAT
jgi:hypothetical protein